MPARTRRHHRKISQVRRTDIPLNAISANGYTDSSGLPIKRMARENEKPLTAIDPNLGKYALSEIKWIGLVTGIILVLLVISYVVFR